MSLVKDSAIVLRRLDYSETSQVLVMLTRDHGQQRLIAKGIKRGTDKRPSIGIDLLELGRIVYSLRPGKEDNLAPLTEWVQEDNFSHLRRDLASLYAAQYAAEVTSQLTELHDPHPILFHGLHELLGVLKYSSALPPLVSFLWLMLKDIGLRPELAVCLNCRRDVTGENEFYFSSHEGGAICRDCEPAVIEKRRVDRQAAEMLRAEAWKSEQAAPAVFELIDYHLREIMGRATRLSDSLRRAVGMPPQ